MQEAQLKQETRVNVALQSTAGHFVEKHEKVVLLDGTKEAFFVEGEAELKTENHQTLPLQNNCLISPQQVYNPYKKALQRSQD